MAAASRKSFEAALKELNQLEDFNDWLEAYFQMYPEKTEAEANREGQDNFPEASQLARKKDTEKRNKAKAAKKQEASDSLVYEEVIPDAEKEEQLPQVSLKGVDIEAIQGNMFDSRADSIWIYNNLDNPKADPNTAPSIGAISMLNRLRKNADGATKFLTDFLTRSQPSRAESEEARRRDKEDEDITDTLAEIERIAGDAILSSSPERIDSEY